MDHKHIEMRGVRKSYRFFTLDDLSLSLEPGEVMGFVGPNGAGKSTTLRMIMGMIAPDAGEIRVLGHAMPDAQAAAKRDIGSCPPRCACCHTPRSAGTCSSSRHLPGMGRRYAALVKRFNLRPSRMQRSCRGRTRQGHAAAGARAPPAPADSRRADHGLDPCAATSHQRVHGRAARRLRSILFSSHNTVDVERISDRITFIDRGRVSSSDKEDFLDRWRRIHVQLPPAHRCPSCRTSSAASSTASSSR
jgi:ABC-2 type transport system ATP-binding protein